MTVSREEKWEIRGWEENIFSTYLILPIEFCTMHMWIVKVTQLCWLFETPWTIQSVEFSRPEYWSGWVAFLFSRRSSQPRNRTGVACIAGGFFTRWAIKESYGKAWQGNMVELSTVNWGDLPWPVHLYCPLHPSISRDEDVPSLQM